MTAQHGYRSSNAARFSTWAELAGIAKEILKVPSKHAPDLRDLGSFKDFVVKPQTLGPSLQYKGLSKELMIC